MPQLKPIESFGLNRPALESITGEMLDVTLNAYNEQYGTDYTKENKPEAIDYFISGLILISLFGWDKADKSKLPKATLDQLENIFKDPKTGKVEYEGINATTQKEFDNAIKNSPDGVITDDQKQKIISSRVKIISESLSTTLFHNINEILATNDGLDYVGAITMGDDLVRPKHQEHNRKYWLRDEYKPWYDFNCRCFYNFGSKEKLENLGYTRLKGI